MKRPMFVLKIFSPKLYLEKYGLSLDLQSNENDENIKPLKTRISDLNDKEDNNFYSFIDESKKNHQCVVTMKSYINKEDLPKSTSLHCFWCRHSFSTIPIGCPIEYVPPRISKTYYSEITKYTYVLRGNITKSQCNELSTNEENNIEDANNAEYNIKNNDYYLMDGLFCSFNCCLAYIKANRTNPLYMDSESLLNKIYFDLFGENCIPLIESPSWRLLKNYGGHITIDEYRKNFYKVEYNDYENIIYPIQSKFVGFLYEKQIKL